MTVHRVLLASLKPYRGLVVVTLVAGAAYAVLSGASIGMIAMLYATGSGADIQKPLAVVVMGGLVTSTLLTLIVLPTIFDWFESRATAREMGEST